MKAEELRNLTREELLEKKRQFVEEQYNLRFQAVTGQLDNSGRVKVVRRTLARINTMLNEKARSGDSGEEAEKAS